MRRNRYPSSADRRGTRYPSRRSEYGAGHKASAGVAERVEIESSRAPVDRDDAPAVAGADAERRREQEIRRLQAVHAAALADHERDIRRVRRKECA